MKENENCVKCGEEVEFNHQIFTKDGSYHFRCFNIEEFKKGSKEEKCSTTTPNTGKKE